MVVRDDALKRVRSLVIPGYGDDEIRLIADTLERFRPEYVFEWGTNVGASARIFYEIGSQFLTLRVVTVEHPDPATHDHPGGRYGLWCEGFEPHIQMVKGDGVTVALELYQLAGEPEKTLFFLDGDHSYDAVTRELELIAENAPLAVILVHDTSHPIEDTETAVEDWLTSHDYHADWLHSQAGMVRLWPAPASA